jgi:hypothetical protein
VKAPAVRVRRLLAVALLLTVGACLPPETGLPPAGGPAGVGGRARPALGSTLRVLQGNYRFGRGDDTAASLRYLQALGSRDGVRWRPWITYDLGTQYVALGELKAGLRRLGEAGEGDPPGPSRAARELAFRRAFNLGVARFEGGEFQEAAWAFIEALRHEPDSWDAKHNLELSIRSSLNTPQRASDAAGPQTDTRGGDQTRRLLQRLHEQEEPLWMSAPSTEAYSQDW